MAVCPHGVTLKKISTPSIPERFKVKKKDLRGGGTLYPTKDGALFLIVIHSF